MKRKSFTFWKKKKEKRKILPLRDPELVSRDTLGFLGHLSWPSQGRPQLSDRTHPYIPVQVGGNVRRSRGLFRRVDSRGEQMRGVVAPCVSVEVKEKKRSVGGRESR